MPPPKRRILFVGHSHTAALRGGWGGVARGYPGVEPTVVNFRNDEYRRDGVEDNSSVAAVHQVALRRRLVELAPTASLTLLLLRGGAHNSAGFLGEFRDDLPRGLSVLVAKERLAYDAWLRFLVPNCGGRVVLVPPPPPIASVEFVLSAWDSRDISARVRENLADVPYRVAHWRRTCELEAEVARAHGIASIDLPADVLDAEGCLALDCRNPDGSHGNSTYGERVLAHVLATHGDALTGANAARRHPYVELPDHRFWKQGVAEIASEAIDPVIDPPFVIAKTDRVATAGSCFAQHISKRLRAADCGFLSVEEPPAGDAGTEPEPDFSARFGNIYTARQLRQLLERALWIYRPVDDVWKRADGRFCDPFRPRIELLGHPTEQAVRVARNKHLNAVQRMFRELDVLVFTLGLTEAWTHRVDGAVYPLAPGVAGGTYDPGQHVFKNFTTREMVIDLRAFFHMLRSVNPRARMILTVSPQPIVATQERKHVLTASTYTKAALRVAAEEFANEFDDVYYFPSYEIVTGNHTGGAYFAADRRSVTERGVDHVMRVFMGRLVETSGEAHATHHEAGREPEDDPLRARVDAVAKAACDEEAIEHETNRSILGLGENR